MKIFWSWQSDTPGKIGRFLVRDALKDAIQELKMAPDVEEPTNQQSREDLHLDQDIQGVPGIPDLARTIFDKIDKSHVVIADVTPVGLVEGGSKRLINSNVAIELGYALRAVGDKKILVVFNGQYGTHEHLPFDLQQQKIQQKIQCRENTVPGKIQCRAAQLVQPSCSICRPAAWGVLALALGPVFDDDVFAVVPQPG